jgi:hypothetical protein
MPPISTAKPRLLRYLQHRPQPERLTWSEKRPLAIFLERQRLEAD